MAVASCHPLQTEEGAGSYLLWVFSGVCHHKLDTPDASIAAYQKATELDPNQSPAWQGLRDLHLERNDVAKLLPVVDKLVHLAKVCHEARPHLWHPSVQRVGRFLRTLMILPLGGVPCAVRALCEKLAVLHHREFGKFRRLKGRH